MILCSICCECLAANIPTISILGFVNRVKQTNTGGNINAYNRVIHDFLIDELADSDKLDLREENNIQDYKLLEKAVSQIEQGKARLVLKDFRTEYVIYGFITNVGIKNSISEFDSFSGSSL